ncbi:hypothetical protein [Paraflavitalea sp. CAU 1676]|uniref:hypothetical protein n=1 Tax=Paraflavitalea sp. CAU 1676 TaxID=3032598 RepID=UPI0023DB652A|nr:hypothetical protein [Paraflavitalea sp. CAU 1676]MDF2189273.1 hypothetical protein [Paraflavitalea sp. CAU 1676]
MKEIASRMSRLKYQVVLSTIVVLGVFLFDYLFFLKEIPVGNKDIANAAFGALNTIGFSLVMNFWFGSSFKERETSGQQKADS